MKRADDGLAFMLQYENVAWYENGAVRILDRRVYPMETNYVVCKTYVEVAKAITDMVTQSGGPYTAAAMGMALAAYEAKSLKQQELLAFMERAAYTLSHARPTTQERMVKVVEGSLGVLKKALEEEAEAVKLPEILFQYALDMINTNYAKYVNIGRYLADQVPPDGTLMTQCFAETVIGMMLKACKERNKTIKLICPETRPYLQGARLTASVICDMGFEVHVITDNMPGYIIKDKHVDVFSSAADVITMDGHIINKIGTFQIALAAHYHGIPYFVTGTPNQKHPGPESVKIEERDKDQVLCHLGQRVTKPGIGAYYPAFDITPPQLCGGVITNLGIYSPFDLASYVKDAGLA
jgi:methylthioribose-1-phosphate isomerase